MNSHELSRVFRDIEEGLLEKTKSKLGQDADLSIWKGGFWHDFIALKQNRLGIYAFKTFDTGEYAVAVDVKYLSDPETPRLFGENVSGKVWRARRAGGYGVFS